MDNIMGAGLAVNDLANLPLIRANASNCQTKTQILYVPRFMRGIQPDPDV